MATIIEDFGDSGLTRLSTRMLKNRINGVLHECMNNDKA